MSRAQYFDTNTVYRLEMVRKSGVSEFFGPYSRRGSAAGQGTEKLNWNRGVDPYVSAYVQALRGEWEYSE